MTPEFDNNYNILKGNGIGIHVLTNDIKNVVADEIKHIAKEEGIWIKNCSHSSYIGMRILYDILQFNIKEIYLLGFTSFQLKTDVTVNNRLHLHNPYANWEWLKRKIISDDRIKPDNMLYNLVYNRKKITHLIRDEFIDK